jgi:hypothetical protein
METKPEPDSQSRTECEEDDAENHPEPSWTVGEAEPGRLDFRVFQVAVLKVVLAERV